MIGQRIRRLRRQQQRTQQEVAELCGFTKSLLCKIEMGKTVPAIATLTKIARVLGTTAAVLLDESGALETVFTRAAQLQAMTLPRTEVGYAFHAFATVWPEKRMQPFLFVARRHEVTAQPLTHAGEEFVYMLVGEMQYRVDTVTYTLQPGDSLYFDATKPHTLEPVSAEVRYLAIFTSDPIHEAGAATIGREDDDTDH